jgi:hypothetical protein
LIRPMARRGLILLSLVSLLLSLPFVQAPVALAASCGSAKQLAFTVQPSNTTAGSTITPAVKVAIQTASGGGTTCNQAVTLAIGTNPSAGTLGGTTTVTASGSDGVATFSDLSIDKAGTGYTLSASSSGLTGATSSTFNITPGAANRVAFSVQPSNTTAGSAITPAVKVEVRDANGNVVTSSSASVTLAIGTNPSSGTLSGTKTVAAVNGVATFSDLSIDKAGTGYTLTAAASGLTGDTSSSFNITPDELASITIAPKNAEINAGGTQLYTAEGFDAHGNDLGDVTTGTVFSIDGTGTCDANACGSEKVATPFTAATVFVPLSVPDAGFVPIATVTDAEEFTRLPFESLTSTLTAGEIDAPEAVFEGWTLKASLFADPAVMLKELLVSPVNPLAAAVRV